MSHLLGNLPRSHHELSFGRAHLVVRVQAIHLQDKPSETPAMSWFLKVTCLGYAGNVSAWRSYPANSAANATMKLIETSVSHKSVGTKK